MVVQLLTLLTAASALSQQALALQQSALSKDLFGANSFDDAVKARAEAENEGLHVPADEDPYEYAKLSWLAHVWPGDAIDAVIYNQTGYASTMTLVTSNTEDIVKVFKKDCTGDLCKRCAVSFRGSNDYVDYANIFNQTMTDFCGAQVHAGTADELRGFYELGLENLSESLSSDKCERVYAVGHSMGGSIASLYAFCANRLTPLGVDATTDKAYFAPAASDVRLVIFGDYAMAGEPLYNGVPGACFEGARFAVSEEGAVRPGGASHSFYDSFFKASSTIAALTGHADLAITLNQTVVTLAALDAAGTPESLADYTEVVLTMTPVANSVSFESVGAMISGKNVPNAMSVVGTLIGLATSNREALEYEWDGVPAAQFGPPSLVLQHALVQFVAIAFPLTTSATKTWETSAGDFTTIVTDHPAAWPKPATCDPQMAGWPIHDQAVTAISNIAANFLDNRLPNHQLGCYTPQLGGDIAADYEAVIGVHTNGTLCRPSGWR